MALPYAPYVTTYDVTVDLNVTPDTRTFNSGTYNRKHVKVIGRTSDIDRRNGLCFYDCASVTIIGGHFEPPVNGFPRNSAGGWAPGTLTFVGCGSVYLEGVVIDNRNIIVTDATIASNGANGGDGIYLSAGTKLSAYNNTSFTAQNCAVLNVRGVQTTSGGSALAHGDIFQVGSNTMGKAGVVRFYNFTGSCNYQGMFMDPQAASTSSANYNPGGNAGIIFNRVNLRRSEAAAASYRLNFLFSSAANYDTRGYPASFTDFYVQGWGTETLENTIWPNHEAGSNNFPTKYRAVYATDTTGRYASYPGLTDAGKAVVGKIYQGAPAGGDFVTVDKVGRNYVQGTDLVTGVVTPPVVVTPTDPGTPAPALPAGTNNRISQTGWISGGTGTATVNAGTGALTVTPANDTTRTYHRQRVAVEVGKTYQITWDLQTSNQMWRMLGTAENTDNIVAVNVSTVTENKLTFTATTSSVWFEFNRVSAGSTTVGMVRFEEVSPGGSKARRLNGRNQLLSIASSARTANSLHYIGGWLKFQYLPTTTVYFADFAMPNSTATGGTSRARLLYDASGPKLVASHGGASLYTESAITMSGLSADTWHYAGIIIGSDRSVKGVWDGTIGATTAGTGIPEAATFFQQLQFGARIAATPTLYAPVIMADWVWCAGFVPTNEQIAALADGNRPNSISGFTPSFYWPLEGEAATEASVASPAVLTASNNPGTAVGPDYVTPVLTEALPLLFF